MFYSLSWMTKSRAFFFFFWADGIALFEYNANSPKEKSDSYHSTGQIVHMQ